MRLRAISRLTYTGAVATGAVSFRCVTPESRAGNKPLGREAYWRKGVLGRRKKLLDKK